MINVEAAPVVDVFTENPTCQSPESGSIIFAFDAESDASSIDLSIDGGENYTTVDVFLGIYIVGNLGEGTYSIVIRSDENSCELVLEDAVLEAESSVSLDAGNDVSINSGESEVLTVSPYVDGVDYVWSTGETTASITVSPNETTTYTVTAINQAGCSAADDVTVNVSTSSARATIDPCLRQKFNVVAYPVPTRISGDLNIDVAIDKDQIVNYAIYNLMGSVVGSSMNVNLPKGCNTINVDLTKYSNFVVNTEYILIVTGDDWSKTIEFITQQ